MAASLWVPAPFYLASTGDAQAWKRALQFLDDRLALGIDFGDLEKEVRMQDETIVQARARLPDIDGYINRLESGLSLTQEENEKLAGEISRLFRERRLR